MSNRPSLRLGWIVAGLCLAGLGAGTLRADETPRDPARNELVFGVFSYLGEERTRAKYQPLVDYLNGVLKEERLRLDVLPQTELDRRIAAGQVDLVTTNPTHFLVARKQQPLTGVVATLVESVNGKPLNELGGVILTSASRREINRLEDLRGKIIAVPGTDNMGGYRAQAYELHLAGLRLPKDVGELRTLVTHEAVVRAVLSGEADVGFVRDGVLERMEAEGALPPRALKIINAQYFPDFPHKVSTRLYPEWPVFALPQVSERSIRHVAAALFALEPDDPAAVAAGIYGYSIPADYLPVEEMARRLRLPPFDVAPDFTLEDALARWGWAGAALLAGLGVILTLSLKLALVLRREKGERARFERLLSTLGEGVYGTDSDGRCTFINAAGLELLGVRESEALGQDQHALFHHHRRDGRPYPMDECPIYLSSRDGQTRRVEEWFFRKDGRGFPVELVVSPLIEQGRLIGSVAVFQDISARKESERQSERLAQRNTLLLESAGDGIFGVDLNGRCIFVNPAALALLGYQREEVIGEDEHLLFHYRHEDGAIYSHESCPIFKTLRDGKVREDEDVFFRHDGAPVSVHLKVTPMVEFGERVGAVVVFQDITERKRMEQRLIELASTDELTGLPNRRHFVEALEREHARIRRFGKSAVLLMLDLDHFKRINDQYGHAAGDAVLVAFAETLRQHLRRTDLAGRLGGEEFAVLLPETEVEAACVLAERLREAVAGRAVEIEGIGAIGVTVSLGLARLGVLDARPEAALARADAALYRAKQGGRNRVELAQ